MLFMSLLKYTGGVMQCFSQLLLRVKNIISIFGHFDNKKIAKNYYFCTKKGACFKTSDKIFSRQAAN